LTGAVWYRDVVVVVRRLLEVTVLYSEFVIYAGEVSNFWWN